MAKKLMIQEAAALMGVSPQYVRIGIQQGVLPFGVAVKVGGNRYTYYISPAKFMEFTGIKLPCLEEVVADG